jgi:Flp pilus assembly protein CpaB
MKQKNLAMLGVAVGCGLVAAVAVAKLSAGGSKGPETVRVLVAKKDLPVQTKLDEKELDNQLTWADVPKAIAPPDAVTDLEEVKDKELTRTLKQGNPVSRTDLGKGNRIEIPDGYKAMTVKATADAATAGFAKPGSKVDVMFSERLQNGKARSAIILRDILVLAIGTVHTNDEKTGAAIQQVENATFAVTDKHAILLNQAEERGKVKMLLRPQGMAKGKDEKDFSTIDEVFDEVAPPPPSPIAPAPPALDAIVVVRKAVPVNTLINADNVAEFFTTIKVEKAPAGVVTNPDDLKGKFIIKPIDEGQTLFKSLTDNKPIEVAKHQDPPIAPPMSVVTPSPMPRETPTPAPKTSVVEKPKFPRYDQVIYSGGLARRVIWLEVAPSKWKAFESEREANAYRPEESSNPKGDESKGEEDKPKVNN